MFAVYVRQRLARYLHVDVLVPQLQEILPMCTVFDQQTEKVSTIVACEGARRNLYILLSVYFEATSSPGVNSRLSSNSQKVLWCVLIATIVAK